MMDLAIVVYVISLMEPLAKAIDALVIVSIVIFVCSIFGMFVVYDVHKLSDSENENDKTIRAFFIKISKISFVLFVLLIFVRVFIPSEKTAYVMAGAYATQKVANDPTVQKISGKVIKVIDTKLDQYIIEGEQKVKEVASAVDTAAKEKVNEVASAVVSKATDVIVEQVKK